MASNFGAHTLDNLPVAFAIVVTLCVSTCLTEYEHTFIEKEQGELPEKGEVD